MEELVPGIWDEKGEANKNLTNFAVLNGFDEVYLSLMTNPATRIIPPDSDTAYMLGDGAVNLVDLITRFYAVSGRPPTRKGSGTGDIIIGGGVKEELEWARLSPQEQRKRLGE